MFVKCRNIKASFWQMTENCVTKNDHPVTIAHLKPINLFVQNYLIFIVFLPKNFAHTRLGIIFAYLCG